jgi:hypothetical protein
MFGLESEKYVMGPYMTADHLGNFQYARFLAETFPFYWKMQPFDVLESRWFQHDGAPS